MNELKIGSQLKSKQKLRLLATVSALTLAGSPVVMQDAVASEADKPTFWIELGGQWNQMSQGQEEFLPGLFSAIPSPYSVLSSAEKPPRHSIDAVGKISFQPNRTPWTFSVAVQYGRSTSNKDVHQQSYPSGFTKYLPAFLGGGKRTVYPVGAKFADTTTRAAEQHLVLDFQVGRDVGLGLPGISSSVLNLGVRFAQFTAQSNIALRSDPDFHFTYRTVTNTALGITNFRFVYGQVYHSNAAMLVSQRSFHGVGPSLSWNASAPVAGSKDSGEVTLDWGLNGAVLFGRQKASANHQTTGLYQSQMRGINQHYTPPPKAVVYGPHHAESVRSRSVIVPNLGGFAGISVRYPNVNVSLGYRADFFFGAMDGGVDTRKTYTQGFHGPFAAINIGLGG